MKTLTIIIPVFNESQRIKETFRAIEKFQCPDGITVAEVIFVDDGSTDNTSDLIKDWNNHAKILSYFPNRGRGYALRQALRQVTTDHALYLDGDMAVPLENIQLLVPAMEEGIALVAGSKKKPGAICLSGTNWLRTLVGLGHSLLAWSVLGVFYWDFQGGFKLFSRELIRNIVPLTSIDRWGFDMEMLFLAKKMGYSSQEVAVRWTGYGHNSKVALIRDIFAAVRDMIAIRWRWETKNSILKLWFQSSYQFGMARGF